MDRHIRFHHEGEPQWTRWFKDAADADFTGVRLRELDAFETSETMTRDEFTKRFPDHPSIQPK